MIVGAIIFLAVGLFLIGMGLVVWKKRKISLVHEYHWRNVREKDIAPYTKRMGIGLILIGLGTAVTGVVELLYPKLWCIPFLAGFISGFIVLHKAQMKYNGSWLS